MTSLPIGHGQNKGASNLYLYHLQDILWPFARSLLPKATPVKNIKKRITPLLYLWKRCEHLRNFLVSIFVFVISLLMFARNSFSLC